MAHATTADLEAWLTGSGFTAPTGDEAEHLLARASDLVDEKVVAWYAVDGAGLPVETEVRNALRDATCAQVEQWLSVGEDNDVDGYPRDTGVGTNGVSLSARPSRLAPRARAQLNKAGLLTTRAW